jgi:DNA (cytosine-5)-methyltransferase 1
VGTPLTFIDLFSGCGGFSLGMHRAEFKCVAAIDFNPEAITTFRANFPDMPEARIRCEDLTKFRPTDLVKIIGSEKVDVIAGGPPCQGFSTARQRDGANHGDRRLIRDDRRQLYREFLRYVEFFQPRVFVMENVLGIQSAAGGEYFTRVQHEARMLGYRVVCKRRLKSAAGGTEWCGGRKVRHLQINHGGCSLICSNGPRYAAEF